MTNDTSAPSSELPEPPPPEPETKAGVAPSLFEIARAFVVIGALAFGGQGGLLALLSRNLVQQRGWVSEEEIAEAFTYVQLLPGAVVVQVTAYLGYRLRRWSGAAVATTCFLLPSVAAMLAFAATYQKVVSVPGIPAAMNGLTAAVVGMIALAAYKQARKTVRDAVGILLAVLVFCGSVVWHLNPALLVVAAGLSGVIREALRKGEPPPTNTKSNSEATSR